MAIQRMVDRAKDCPDVRHLFDGPDICALNDNKVCLLECDEECPYYNEWLEEIKDE